MTLGQQVPGVREALTSMEPAADDYSESSEKSQEQAVTVVSASKRADVVLGKSKSQHKDIALEKKLLDYSGDSNTGFLMQKKNVEQVVANRLKKLDSGKGAAKKLKTAAEKIIAKQIDCEDLPTSSDELIKTVKTMCKELKAKKKALPSCKKGSLPAIQKELSVSADTYQASWLKYMVS